MKIIIINGLIKNWISLAEAEKALNISKSSICQCAKGKNKTGGGFIWKYKMKMIKYENNYCKW